MRGPTPRFYIGFGSTWTTLNASISWTEVTAYVMSERGASVSRGRSSELDDYRAGTCSFVLRNGDRRFDPTYTSGPYYGNLKPGVPVKITGTANGTEYPVFRGFVNGWPQDYDLSNKLGVVNLTATDGFGKLATAGTPSSVYALEVATDSPKAWWRLAETRGESLADSSSNKFDGTYGADTHPTADHPAPFETIKAFAPTADTTTVPVVRDSQAYITALPVTVEGIIALDPDMTDVGVINGASKTLLRQGGSDAEPRIFVGFSPSGSNWAIFSGNNLDGNTTAKATWTGYTLTIDDLLAYGDFIHYVYRATVANPNGTIWFNGAAVSTSNITAGNGEVEHSIFVGCNRIEPTEGVVADIAVYDTSLSNARVTARWNALTAPWDGDTTGERITRILDLGWPSDLLDLADGFTTLGPATLGQNQLALIKGYEKAEQGRFFISRDGKATFLDRYYNQLVAEGSASQATFSDDGSDNSYCSIAFDYDDRLVYNRIRGSRTGGSPLEVYDQTSIDTYGEQVDSSLNDIQLGTDALVRGVAELRLDRYKDPQLRVRPVEVKLHGFTAVQQADVLGLELGWRVTVERTPQRVGSAITQETAVEGISHRIAGGQWTTTLTMSPVDTRVYAIWGTALWDTGLWGY